MNRHINLTKRICTPKGLPFCPVVVSANGRVKLDCVIIGERGERHPEGPSAWKARSVTSNPIAAPQSGTR
jgi:hypothetical protein